AILQRTTERIEETVDGGEIARTAGVRPSEPQVRPTFRCVPGEAPADGEALRDRPGDVGGVAGADALDLGWVDRAGMFRDERVEGERVARDGHPPRRHQV